MKTLIKHLKENIFIDGQNNQWIRQNGSYYGYNQYEKTVLNHISKPEAEFQVLGSPSVASNYKREPEPVISNIAAELLECGS